MIYAGFWRRFGAVWLDILFLLPLTGLSFWLSTAYRLFDLYLFIPSIIFGLFYSVYLVQRFGGTPGKLVAGLQICKLDGTKIGYREAFLRYLPEALMAITLSVGLICASFAITDSEYFSLGPIDRTRQLTTLAPAWYYPLNIILQIWACSEFIVMMTNSKRRALHDFIAGTVVVVSSSGDVPQVSRPVGATD